MVANKVLTYTLLAMITLTPWNATAVHRFSLSNLLPKAKLSTFFGDNTRNPADLAENLLVKGLLEITQGQNEKALNTIDQVIKATPNFKLAHLVRGDLLMAQGRSIQSFGNHGTNQSEQIKDLQDEARARIESYLSQRNRKKIPDLIIAPNEQQSHLIVVDADRFRLYLYKNEDGTLKYMADYYVTVGKNGIIKQSEGDKRTPIGVYVARSKLTQPLPDFYGDGAFPLNYPNAWDKENNRNGSGIWIHGTPSNTYSRPPRASDGCIVVTNQDLQALTPYLQSGKTPVIIANHLNWLDNTDQATEKQKTLSATIDQWLNDWREQNTEAYLSHYSKEFSSNGILYPQWAEHKQRVQTGKPEVTISLSDMSIFSYPDEQKQMAVVDFVQSFNSATLKNKMYKRQYWIQEDGHWKIIYEGAA